MSPNTCTGASSHTTQGFFSISRASSTFVSDLSTVPSGIVCECFITHNTGDRFVTVTLHTPVFQLVYDKRSLAVYPRGAVASLDPRLICQACQAVRGYLGLLLDGRQRNQDPQQFHGRISSSTQALRPQDRCCRSKHRGSGGLPSTVPGTGSPQHTERCNFVTNHQLLDAYHLAECNSCRSKDTRVYPPSISTSQASLHHRSICHLSHSHLSQERPTSRKYPEIALLPPQHGTPK